MKIVIFGGTIEGRVLAEELLEETDARLIVFVATEYGATLLPKAEALSVHVGRLDEEGMQEMLKEEQPDFCVDATHPYATLVTNNVYMACQSCQVKYLRVQRETDLPLQEQSLKEHFLNEQSVIQVESVKAAVDYLVHTEGRIFVTTGSKELDAFTALENYRERVIARVLPTKEVMDKCDNLGFAGKNLICMQGPFSEELNYAMFKACEAKYLVTKSSGTPGGYIEKCEAALRAGMALIVVGRPMEQVQDCMSLDAVLSILKKEAEG